MAVFHNADVVITDVNTLPAVAVKAAVIRMRPVVQRTSLQTIYGVRGRPQVQIILTNLFLPEAGVTALSLNHPLTAHEISVNGDKYSHCYHNGGGFELLENEDGSVWLLGTGVYVGFVPED